jgi:hypothetical protein
MMFYRIMKAPPGYPPEQQYLVGAYQSLAYDSYLSPITKADGSRFAATLDEARRMVPAGARLLSSPPEDQFVELWEE